MRAAVPAEAECRRGGMSRAFCGNAEYSITWDDDASTIIMMDVNSEIRARLEKYLAGIVGFQQFLGFAPDSVRICIDRALSNFEEWQRRPNYSTGVKPEQITSQGVTMRCQVVGGYNLSIKSAVSNKF